MALQFFNTLSRRKEDFVPLDPAGKRVSLYTCGPTVYNFAHIGNFRTYVFEDLLRRYLEYKGFDVQHVMNITDVEDKIIEAVKREKSPLVELTARYTKTFFEDRDVLNIKPAHQYPRATEHMTEMFRMIEVLLSKGIAYRSEDGSIYYSIEKFPEYGRLAHIHVDELKPGERVKHDEYEKETVADFALWKAWDEADGEVKWDSPWGPGRPGWHLECSAMSIKYLGEQIDVHCGGVDNIFPHHQNEIAQSEPCTGKQFVKYWLHSAHLQVEGRKMSKSLGNFYTLRDLLEKGWTGREIRYALISTHYREQVNFTFDGLQAARSALQRIDEFLSKLQEIAQPPASDSYDPPHMFGVEFVGAMNDDLNISGALGAVFDFIRFTNKKLTDGSLHPTEAQAILDEWDEIDKVLGFGIPTKSDVPTEIQQLVDERQTARETKDFKRSDEIRDQLAKQGWTIEDTPKGPRAKQVG
jgi:cysteinyl-tRNA synthetase